MNVQIINPNNHTPPPPTQWLLCHSDRSLSYVWCGEKPLHLYHVQPHLWLSLLQHSFFKGHKCFLFSIHAHYVLSVRILTKWGNSSSRGKKKGLTELPEKHWGFGNNGMPCCDFVILDTHRTPDIPLTIRRHSFCLTNHGSVCKSTPAALERKPWDNLTNMVTSPAKEKGKKAD